MSPIVVDELKLVLKKWEHEFYEINGKRPERQDIKATPEIAEKYKEYRKLLDIEKHRLHEKTERKREVDNKLAASRQDIRTPKKKNRHNVDVQVTTPSGSSSDYEPAYKGNAVARGSAKKSFVSIIGPTPQHEGKVLGIFDIAPDPVPDTPISNKSNRDVIFTTPTKLITPTKAPLSCSPSYFRHAGKLTLTPSPFKQKRVARGLTSILAALRKEQDDAYNEEESILSEMQAEELASNGYHLGEIQEDDQAAIDKIIDDSFGDTAQYKRKPTQKRSTRRVKMRPVIGKDDIQVDHGLQDMEDNEEEHDYDSGDDYEEVEDHNASVTAQTKTATAIASKSHSSKKPGGTSNNFQRLKLRNSGAKGARRFNGRWRTR
ncbi:DNA replication/checkpoint protein [Lipomyces japonicus]|uniref:DNA replication/checkpoint protein n=1 Tax=Lipomyces japonicus TaxID=56871 RepID=UPI0034CFB137